MKAAVFNGADEVYLGINDFNARNNIDGFSLQSLKEAVDFAHVYNVKVCLAINILFSDDEIQSALDVVVEAFNLGVDAFIIQDLGLASLLHSHYPQIEIHASTQMGLHNLEGVEAVLKYGFKRIVLARETPLDEIKRIKRNCKVEIEYFAQGALCVSFSGNCYLSSYLCNASGNRGKCKQLCRLPYLIEKDGKILKKGFLLSAKDFNMIDRLAELKDAGVDVLKIEGRARRPFYVATATREYYNALRGKKISSENLKLAFNRDYTAGYFDGNGKVISGVQNHTGIFVGEVKKVVSGKNFNEVFISSSRELSPKSTFKTFDNGVEKTTFSAYDLKKVQKDLYKLTTTQRISVGERVHLIVDALQEENVLKQTKRRPIAIKIFASTGLPIRAEFEHKGSIFEVSGSECEPAIKQPISAEQLKENFCKSDLFEAHLEICQLDNIFMPKQKLNEFRRSVFDKIFEKLTEINHEKSEKIKVKCNYDIKKLESFQIVESLSESFDAENMIYSPSVYLLEEIQNFQKKCAEKNKKSFLDMPNFALEKDIELLENIISKTKIAIVANNYYAFGFDTEIAVGWGLNVYNHFTAREFDKKVATAESEVSSKIKAPYMTLRHCPMKNHLKANCANCPYAEGFCYKMESGKALKLKRKKLSSCTFYLTD